MSSSSRCNITIVATRDVSLENEVSVSMYTVYNCAK